MSTTAADLRFGDCLAVLRELPDESVDVVITDPPYGLADLKPAQISTAFTAWLGGDRDHVPNGRGFMGREWDAFVPPPAVWDECLRVLKPGGHLAAFAGSRTYDLMGMSIRLAGFEIRDGLQWLYGSGFPKGQSVGKAIDKAAGAERPVIGRNTTARIAKGSDDRNLEHGKRAQLYGAETGCDITAPATPEAARWEGWNTSLKPSQEPIVLARKPLSGTVAANVLAHGTGALNVDATRVSPSFPGPGGSSSAPRSHLGSPLGIDVAAPERGPGSARCTCAERPACSTDDTSPGRGSGSPRRSLSTPEAVPADSGPEGRSALPASAPAGGLDLPLPPGSPDGYPSSPRSDGGRAPSAVGGARASAQPSRGADESRGLDATSGRSPAGQSTACAQCTAGDVHRPAGRWPANVLLSHSPECHEPGECVPGCPVAELNAQSGTLKSGSRKAGEYGLMGYMGADTAPMPEVKGDSGSASRFFPSFRYQAKAPSSERPKIDGKGWPTVKPQGLMRWLVRLLTPPGGVVLDPFAGTSATLQAARDEGFASIGIERDEFAYLLSCKRLGLPELVPAAVVDMETSEPVSLVEVAEPADLVLAEIAAADSDEALTAAWEQHREAWTDEHTAAVRARLAELEQVSAA